MSLLFTYYKNVVVLNFFTKLPYFAISIGEMLQK